MADSTTTIKPSGGDYTSLETALAAKETDLTTKAGKWTFEISGTFSGDDINNVDVGDWGTSTSAYYVDCVKLSGNYVLAPTGASHAVVIDQAFTRFRGIPIHLKDDPQNSSEGIRMDAGSNESVVDKCEIWHNGNDTDVDGIYCWNSNSHSSPHIYYVYNTIIYGFTRAGINHQCYVNNSDTTSVVIRGCTIWDCGATGEGEGAAIHAKQQYSGQTVNVTIYNTIAADTASYSQEGYFQTGTYLASINTTGDYNAETENDASGNGPDVVSMPDDGGNTVYTGGTYHNKATDSTSPGLGLWVIFVDLPTATRHPYDSQPDLHIADDADNDVLAQGAAAQNPPSPYAADIDGDTRADPPDIGADEVAAGGGPSPQALSDGVGVADSLLGTQESLRADGVSVGDAFLGNQAVALTDGVGVADAQLGKPEALYADGVSVGDSVSTPLIISLLQDSITVGDNVLGNATVLIADGVGVGDTVGAFVAFLQTLSDAVTIGDSASTPLMLSLLSDLVTTGDSISTPTQDAKLSDGVSVGDTFLGNMDSLLVDGISIGDIVAAIVQAGGPTPQLLSDGVSVSDSITTPLIVSLLSDQVTVADSLKGKAIAVLVEPITVSDSLTVIKLHVQVLSDGVALSDELLGEIAAKISQTISVSDEFLGKIMAKYSDAVTVGDTAQATVIGLLLSVIDMNFEQDFSTAIDLEQEMSAVIDLEQEIQKA